MWKDEINQQKSKWMITLQFQPGRMGSLHSEKKSLHICSYSVTDEAELYSLPPAWSFWQSDLKSSRLGRGLHTQNVWPLGPFQGYFHPSPWYSSHSPESRAITKWFCNCISMDRRATQRTVRTAERIIRVSLPSSVDIYAQSLCRATSTEDDPTHPHPSAMYYKASHYKDLSHKDGEQFPPTGVYLK